jgi:beta-lactam-binding protein with PASTA domain
VSETQIDAVAPASATTGSVPVSVTTPAGTATASQTFAYEGCAVPKLKGKKLKPAKKRLAKALCKIGNVKLTGGATKKTGKVKKQNPKPGRLLAPGSKVNVKLG